MADLQQLKALWQAHLGSTNQKYNVTPGATALGATGVQAISDGAAITQVWSAYVTVIAAATIPDPCWLVGAIFWLAITDAPLNCDFAIATGTAGSETDLVELPVVAYVPSAAGMGVVPSVYLPFPIKLLGQPRLSVRIRKLSGAGVQGMTCKLIIMTGLGT